MIGATTTDCNSTHRGLTWLERRKAAWTARRDSVESDPFTTAEMMRSEEPCEMARTLTPELPRARKNLPVGG